MTCTFVTMNLKISVPVLWVTFLYSRPNDSNWQIYLKKLGQIIFVNIPKCNT